MKKIYILTMAALLGVAGAMAQANPDRVIINKTDGTRQGFLAERIESMVFDQIEGEVKAKIDFKGYSETDLGPTVTLGVKKTAQCQGYKITVVPPAYKGYVSNDEGAISYLENMGGSQMYYDDFDSAALTGWTESITPGGTYTVVTVAYDKYGIACMTDRATFTTPKANVIGNPSVECKVSDVTTTGCTLTFTPNEDCWGYSFCIFEKGLAEKQLETFGPMFGFSTIDEMVMTFGGQKRWERYEHTYTDLEPGTDYEVLIAVLDEKDNFGNLVTVPVSTISLGGTGEALVNITIGEASIQMVENQPVCVQRVVFTPNENTARYRDMILGLEAYNSPEWSRGDEDVKAYLGNDDPSGMGIPQVGWNHYDVDNDEWSLDPGKSYHAIAWAQNANKEWGPLNKVEFTTKSAPAGAPAAKVSKGMQPRRMEKTSGTSSAKNQFQLPAVKKERKIELK